MSSECDYVDQGCGATKTCTHCVVAFEEDGRAIYAPLYKHNGLWRCSECDSSYGPQPHPDLHE